MSKRRKILDAPAKFYLSFTVFPWEKWKKIGKIFDYFLVAVRGRKAASTSGEKSDGLENVTNEILFFRSANFEIKIPEIKF